MSLARRFGEAAAISDVVMMLTPWLPRKFEFVKTQYEVSAQYGRCVQGAQLEGNGPTLSSRAREQDRWSWGLRVVVVGHPHCWPCWSMGSEEDARDGVVRHSSDGSRSERGIIVALMSSIAMNR